MEPNDKRPILLLRGCGGGGGGTIDASDSY